ncbi:hypothetical protein QBC34DRAFT_438485 [Podospora aff. communis PSN243]|uniref:Ankyrin repeat protein n=1 Tax=Podospora aff. communis PSN243 TaxID=3040156 RepID=A0AAV9GKI8_9PEZI|nr:hypothetical protein QBC34DRAFT_438485 [Podospora aff. communis PSN243]
MRRNSDARSPFASPRASGDHSRQKPSVPPARGGRATLDDDGNSTCISALPHYPDADRDSLFQHFLGCLEFHQRAWFLDYEKNPFWKTQVQELVDFDIDKRKATSQEVNKPKIEKETEERVKKTIQALAISIEAQFKRTSVLRQALSKQNFTDQPAGSPRSVSDGSPPHQSQLVPPGQSQVQGNSPAQTTRSTEIQLPDGPELKSLVWYINKSREEWRSSGEYAAGIEKVRTWRKNQKPPLPTDTDTGKARGSAESEEPGRQKVREIVKELRGEDSITKEKVSKYDLERDVNAYLIQYTRLPKISSTDNGGSNGVNSSDPKLRHLPARPYEENLADVRFKGKFPDQRVSVDLLLRSAHTKASDYNRDIPQKGSTSNDAHGNILSKDECDKDDPTRMRYLHIPANNMEWVESAIAGYYGDKHSYKQPALRSGRREFPATTKTQMLLRAQYWRGQLHGARSGAVHARYMRPLCERISSSVHVIEENPNNIVLFMPYMHWETDRMRNTVAKMIDDQSQKQLQKQEDRELEAKKKRKEQREGVGGAGKQLKHSDPQTDDHPKAKPAIRQLERALTLTGVVKKVATLAPGRIEIEQDGHLKVSSGHKLGQYLLDAARLYEAMSTFRDQRMIEKFLYHNPPLHPRRTLDQSHYWTLKTTKARDRDQVVYRGTNINLEVSHKLCEILKDAEDRRRWTSTFPVEAAQAIVKKWKSLTSNGSDQGDDRKSDKVKCWQWDGHWSKTDTHGCEHCTSEIKKISKLIMVDQLWMWVLDEQTIITSFPRRYGYNKFDLHGIHKSIRNRLSNARKNQIRSIFDVALIILDECTNTFFDRTKTHDSQPQVMDIFSEAIGDVTNKHTISFQHVWHWTQKASKVYRSKSEHNETSDLHVPLLDIHPEGKLQREVKDILDELDIMINITRRQRELIRRFCRHVENILDPDGRWRHGSEDQSHGVVEDEEPNENEAATRSSAGRRAASSASNGDGASSGKGVASEEERAKKEAEKRDKSRRKKHLEWFRMQSQDLLCEVGDRIEELEGLRESAKSTAQSVNDLLNLKQQQASVVQAWESVNQAEEAVRQGRAIMMFTIITIIFLPLSFMSSIFGMNNVDLEGPGNTWTLRGQLELMFPIAIGITVASLFFAFFGYLRAFIWSTYTYMITLFVVKTGLYGLWLDYRGKYFRSATLMRTTTEKVHLLKEDVRKAKRRKSKKTSQEKPAGDGGDGAGGTGVAEVKTEPSEEAFLGMSVSGLKKFKIKLGLQEVKEDSEENGKETEVNGQEVENTGVVTGERGGSRHRETGVGNQVRRRSPSANGRVGNHNALAGTPDIV